MKREHMYVVHFIGFIQDFNDQCAFPTLQIVHSFLCTLLKIAFVAVSTSLLCQTDMYMYRVHSRRKPILLTRKSN